MKIIEEPKIISGNYVKSLNELQVKYKEVVTRTVVERYRIENGGLRLIDKVEV